ncbi:MAG: hypothetical protein HDR14_09280 [Lachnospiraceae bacterium]|nr:hypothetical protein [Lachnospiraceae bacterium]
MFLLLVCAGRVDGCGKSKNELQVDAARIKREPDKEEWYQFIIDADGTVLIEIENHFFRLERKQRRMDKCR